MKKLTAIRTFEINLEELHSEELEFELMGETYCYSPETMEWSYLYCTDEYDGDIVLIEKDKDKIEALNSLLMDSFESHLWDTIQEDISDCVINDREVDFELHWDRLEHQDYVNTNNLLVKEVERLTANNQTLKLNIEILKSELEGVKMDASQFEELYSQAKERLTHQSQQMYGK